MGTENKGWRNVVHGYLHACREDIRRQWESKLTGSEACFLKDYGTPFLREGFDHAAKTRGDLLEPLASQESYEVIEEGSQRVVVQVDRPSPLSSGEIVVPLFTTRFVLIEGESGWKIAEIYHPCISCNLPGATGDATRIVEIGKCSFCGGRGTDWVQTTQDRKLWIFRWRISVNPPCKRCDGTGKCPECSAEKSPGWRQVFSLDDLGSAAPPRHV